MGLEQRSYPGASFSSADVAGNYIYRPPYPAGVFETLVAIAPSLDSLLDIGCGPGKLSRPLSHHFSHVSAVDPSEEMISLGRSLERGDAENIEWISGFGESFQTERKFDLTVAGASIHWMDHERLFAHLRTLAKPGHVVAVVAGDAPHRPAWQDDWSDFLGRWIPLLTDHAFDHETHHREGSRYKSHLNIMGGRDFVSDPFTQSIADFVCCQHSRDTFAPSNLGDRREAFDAELTELLGPHAKDGLLTFRVATSLDWGTIRCG